MDGNPGLTKAQIAKLASLVDSWTPESGDVDRAEFRDDAPDAILDLRVRQESGKIIPVRVRLRRRWLDEIPTDELGPHVRRILAIVAKTNSETMLGTDDPT